MPQHRGRSLRRASHATDKHLGPCGAASCQPSNMIAGIAGVVSARSVPGGLHSRRCCTGGPVCSFRSASCSGRREATRRRISRACCRPDNSDDALNSPSDGHDQGEPEAPLPPQQQQPAWAAAAAHPTSCDLDAEWQAFILASGRLQQPKPLIWSDIDGRSGTSSDSSSSGGGGGSTGGSGDDYQPRRDQQQHPPTSSSPRARGGSSSSGWRDVTTSTTPTGAATWGYEAWDELEPVPVPANLPVNEDPLTLGPLLPLRGAAAATAPSAGVAEQLWAAAAAAGQAAARVPPPGLLAGHSSLWSSLREVYVLLFGVGQETEGIYSLRALSDEGLPTETIIAFEAMDDAVRYAALLEATMEHSPQVCSIPPCELVAFCADSGYRCRLELCGSLLMPPDCNVHVTDWERSLRLREGHFYVLPEEPVQQQQQQKLDRGGQQHEPTTPGMVAGTPAVGSSQALPLRAGELTAAQLDSLRAQLEALLPVTPADSHDSC